MNRWRMYRRRRYAAKECVQCGRPNARWPKRLCGPCVEKYYRTPSYRARNAAYLRQRKRECVENGLCLQCRNESPRFQLCMACRVKRATRRAEKRQAEKRGRAA